MRGRSRSSSLRSVFSSVWPSLVSAGSVWTSRPRSLATSLMLAPSASSSSALATTSATLSSVISVRSRAAISSFTSASGWAGLVFIASTLSTCQPKLLSTGGVSSPCSAAKAAVATSLLIVSARPFSVCEPSARSSGA